MTATKIDPKAIAQAKPEVPHISATFGGTFYRAAGGGKGKEYVPWEKKVKVPLSVVVSEALSPIAYFRKYKEAKLMQDLQGNSIRDCYLRSVEGELPRSMSQEHEAHWLATLEDLRELAQKIGKKAYIRYDRKDDSQTQAVVELKLDLYPDVEKLRQAIIMILTDVTAFAFHQERVEEARKKAQISYAMEADIAALSDD